MPRKILFDYYDRKFRYFTWTPLCIMTFALYLEVSYWMFLVWFLENSSVANWFDNLHTTIDILNINQGQVYIIYAFVVEATHFQIVTKKKTSKFDVSSKTWGYLTILLKTAYNTDIIHIKQNDYNIQKILLLNFFKLIFM